MWTRFVAAFSLCVFPFAAALPARGSSNTVEYAVQVSAAVQTTPPRITLQWLPDRIATPTNYMVHRRTAGATSWGEGIAIPGNQTAFVDRNVRPGTLYEYQVVKQSPRNTGYGYIASGIQLPEIEYRGKLLLVVENTYAEELDFELNRLKQDLVGDGWSVIRLDVNRADSVQSVKHRIQSEYNADPSGVKAVFLFGHVPVPYSGNIAPDGHYREHEGAWPSDGYYADMDGVWTDHQVNVTIADEKRNHNVPGDGKFDQSTFPSELELMIGRVDLANMPGRLSAGGSPTFASEPELLRNYLNKNHRFRMKGITVPERGIVGDFFGVRDGEAFAASGWRTFAPFFGPANVSTLAQPGAWIPTLRSNAHLWAYACGSGSYTSIGGIGQVGVYDDGVTTDIVGGNIQAVFTMLYGSWLGDWDSEDNMQRAVLATPDYGLATVWSGRPHWFLHHMAVGQTLGFSTRLTQNNAFNGLYKTQRNSCNGWTHIALMGDPTLRMHTVAPPRNLQAEQADRAVILNWAPAHDAVEGYHVYRAPDADGPFVRIGTTTGASTAFIDSEPLPSGGTYMVRSVKLQASASGTYHNLSQGVFAPVIDPQQQQIASHSAAAPSAAAASN